MIDEAEYASDTDESDEDYTPGQDGAIGSEVESEGEIECDEDNKVESKRGAAKRKSTTSTGVTTKRSKQLDEWEKPSTEKDVLNEDDDENEDALWANFLSSAGESTSKRESLAAKKPETKPTSSISSKGISQKPIARAPIKKQEQQLTEVFEFAGERVEVQKKLTPSAVNPASSNSATPGESSTTKQTNSGQPLNKPSSSGGISSILGQIGKKNKLSVLQKTHLDWTSFKSKEGIDEELQTFNKGRDGFLERQDFLQRTDLRQFEIEKSLRQSKRKN